MSVLDDYLLEQICADKGYTLQRILGDGGMSRVWLARTTSGEPVAIKVPRKTQVALEKIRVEIEVLSKLNHKNIVKPIEAFEIYGIPILVREYAKGNDLEQYLNGEPLDEREALARVTQILSGLDHLHSMGYVHRDVRPKNIIVDKDIDYLKIIDLGTAHYIQSSKKEAVFAEGGYTPPEQYRKITTLQSDLWSVGAILYYMLTARHPKLDMPGYPNSPCPPPDPRKWNKDISDNVAAIIARAMKWDPSERFSSAKEMMMAIKGNALKSETHENTIDVPILEIYGREIPVETPKLIFAHGGNIPEGLKVVKEGDTTYVYIHDPNHWVSRMHFEIFRQGNKWFIRDLGSLNYTAIVYGGVFKEIWAGRYQPSQPVELPRGSLIWVAYGKSRQPYVILTFK